MPLDFNRMIYASYIACFYTLLHSLLILRSDIHNQVSLFSYLLSSKLLEITVACDLLGEVQLRCLHHV